MDFQDLKLEVGQLANCSAGYPKKSRVVVKCIKPFSEASNRDYIINNAREFVEVTYYGLIGLSTSHICSSNWILNN